jgi:hypothetical protein
MAQLYPIVTAGLGGGANDAVAQTEPYLTQPVIMFNIESPSSRVVLRTTLNFEGITQQDGELTFGGWGEGHIDRRHPHTVLHEAVLSVNLWNAAGGALSLSGGKGFAPFGTDDPMSRPVVKFPTNHHLSQILERFFMSGAFRRSGWSLEAGVFSGSEPTGPYDFGNIESFANSWSARLTRRFGGTGPMAAWEVAASYGHVVEEHHDGDVTGRLFNGYVRHERALPLGRWYALVEASRSEPVGAEQGYWAVVAETQLERGRHQPYLRFEASTRPEYERDGTPGTDGFFRYHHDDEPIGATRWFIASAGYNHLLTRLPLSVRPFVEVQYDNVANHRGDVSARALFGTTRFFSFTAGARLYFGGGPMRMGSYGVLDAMSAMASPASSPGDVHRHD